METVKCKEKGRTTWNKVIGNEYLFLSVLQTEQITPMDLKKTCTFKLTIDHVYSGRVSSEIEF